MYRDFLIGNGAIVNCSIASLARLDGDLWFKGYTIVVNFVLYNLSVQFVTNLVHESGIKITEAN